MSGLPSLTVNVGNGNLLRTVSVGDGLGALVATVSTTDLIGKVNIVYSLKDAISKGYTLAAEPFMYGLLKEFYEELGSNMKLYVFGTVETEVMADTVDSTNDEGLIKLLTAAQGNINMVAIARNPVAGYDAGTAFLDSDVSATVTASKTLAAAWQAKNKPFRLLIEGRVANASVANAYSPNTASNGFAGVVLGGTSSGGSAAVSIALARACKYGAQVKLGNGQNGSLTAEQIYIGTDTLENRLDLDTLASAGFIVFMTRDGQSGYFFGVDYMCSDDDYTILARGRIIDKAQRVVAATLTPYLESDIDVDDDGSPSDDFCAHLEKVAEQAIASNMGSQISNKEVIIDNTQGSSSDTDSDTSGGIVNTSTLKVQVRILPKGYLTWLIVDLGLTSEITA